MIFKNYSYLFSYLIGFSVQDASNVDNNATVDDYEILIAASSSYSDLLDVKKSNKDTEDEEHTNVESDINIDTKVTTTSTESSVTIASRIAVKPVIIRHLFNTLL